jgi:hypothetical protein
MLFLNYYQWLLSADYLNSSTLDIDLVPVVDVLQLSYVIKYEGIYDMCHTGVPTFRNSTCHHQRSHHLFSSLSLWYLQKAACKRLRITIFAPVRR